MSNEVGTYTWSFLGKAFWMLPAVAFLYVPEFVRWAAPPVAGGSEGIFVLLTLAAPVASLVSLGMGVYVLVKRRPSHANMAWMRRKEQ